MIKTQKIMSPVFPAAECLLRLSVYATQVGGSEYLSMCLESKDTEKGPAPSGAPERSCWCLFRMTVLSDATVAAPDSRGPVHRDSYGRFAADTKTGDNTSLGWNDFQLMSDFVAPAGGYLVDNTATFSVSFHVIKEAATFTRPMPPLRGAAANDKKKKAERERVAAAATTPATEPFQGKFVWRIENFTRLKDLLKKRRITGLCIKSRRFQVGGRDLRLIVYPRGQSQPPQHLSMFLEVTHPRSAAPDWSCFVSHRLAVACQRDGAGGMELALVGANGSNGHASNGHASNGSNGAPAASGKASPADRSVAKESQNRYSRTAKDWGWREFITLTSLFDADTGFLVNDAVTFSADVLILKELCELRAAAPAADLALLPSGAAPPVPPPRPAAAFAWRVENFGASC